MFRLLAWQAEFIFAVLGLAFRAGTWLVRLSFRSKSQPAAAPQLPAQSFTSAPPPAPIATQASPPAAPTINVTINLPPEAVARPATPKLPEAPAAPPTAAAILARPDHQIYVTTGSHLMFPHPRGAELLERLDHMLYVAAHRDGDPFTVPPALDDSLPASNSPPLATPLHEDDGFDPVTPAVLPPADGALWVARLGHKPERVAGS